MKDDVSVVDRAIKKCRDTFATHKTRPLSYRIQQLRNFKQGVRTMTTELSDAVKADLGRDQFTNWFIEINILEHELDHTIEHLHQWAKDKYVDTPMMLGPATSKISYEPFGVVLIMGSWNYPLYTLLGPMIHAMAGGNTIIIKPSEIAPHVSNAVKRLVIKYLDTNSYICIEGAVQVAIALTNKKFDLICYTGSSEKGKLVAQAAGKNLVPCILELGGKCPTVVDESANIDFAAQKIALGRFINAGQTCIAPDFVLVHHSKL